MAVPATAVTPESDVLISLVLPVYGVEEFLRPCLDAILAQSFTRFEIIAVDDASPDGCPAILDEYARRDARVRVVRLAVNGGLGEARNAGFAQARGTYVWFVDSDDWIADGSLAAIAPCLEASRPDVLFLDYARAMPGGTIEPSPRAHLLREPIPPETFDLTARPSVLELMMTAWNKVIRRDFLTDLDLRFGRGLYEDLPVTYPILLAAERIALLDRVCYFYRERRAGAITTTVSDRHFDVFGQYEKIFDFVDRHGDSFNAFRGPLFDRAIWHYTTIIDDPARIPSHRRREFFQLMAAHFTRYRPAGYTYPHGARGAKFRMVARDSYRLFIALRPVNRLRLQARQGIRTTKRIARTTARRARALPSFLYYEFQRRLPLDEHLAVYAAYWYRGYSCNPRAIYERARELAPDIHGVWIVRRDAVASLPPDVDYVVEGSRRALRLLARAKYLVNNVNFPHTIAKRPGSVHLQTLHGTPLKVMGLDQERYPSGARDMSFTRLREHSARWDYLLSANPHSSGIWPHAYPGSYELLEYGYPRNDRYFNTGRDEIAAIREGLGIAPEQTAVLYAPTHREYAHVGPLLDPDRLAAELKPDHVLMLRSHYYDAEGKEPESGGGRVLDVSKHPVVEDLCLAADVLVTDYSSIMFDYAGLDRPIIVYAPDWEMYRSARGVTFDLLEQPPGAIATTEEELAKVLLDGHADNDAAKQARAEFRNRFCTFDDGRAAERVVRRVFLGQESASGSA
ncbi:bifunctional glycosyltransferase family 2 protein/CDP-glycerol:glycerophosphate glycerophosphotransferase [Streptomyces sp. NPDC001185]|uniref:bifunctional glycosyltransferase/CDP-glycerol:glycerophosphate glycerophosphotransferase n=1 Tax=Streptomyces sp. NPDC001185 TaxID=3154380 RepID=UPI00332F72D9